MSEQLNFKQVPFDTMYYNNLTKQGGQVLIECDPNRTVLKIIESCITKNNTVLSNAELAQWILRYYIARTKNHVGMVQVCASYLKEFFTFGGYFERFMAKVQQHDYDKFSGNEHVASYAMNAPLYKYPNLYDISPEAKRIYEEIEWPKHHQLHDHHPEHYMRYVDEENNAWMITDDEMEEFFKDKGGHPAALMALGEMVADWMAVGIEMGNTAKSWWLQNKDIHWSYGPKYTQALEACLAFAPEQLFIDQIEPIPDPPKLRTAYSSESSHVVIRKESDINSVSDLKVFFSRCRYGLVDTTTGRLWRETHKTTTKQDYYDHWKLLSADELIKYKCGICYDTVLLTKTVFDRLNIKYKMFYAYCNKGDGPTHTFIIYQCSDGWRWLEASWGPFKENSFVSPNSNTLVSWIGKALANAAGIQQQILELNNYPKPGVTMKDFQQAVLKGSKHALIDPDRNSSSNESLAVTTSIEGLFDPVKEEGMHYTIRNFPVIQFFNKLRKEYKTSKLEHLFDVIGIRLFSANKRTIVIHKFFVPELLYLLDKYNFPNSLITTIRSNTWVGAVRPVTGSVDLNYINQTMQVSLYDHQTEFLKSYLPNKIKNHLRGYLLSFEQGLGKTITSICLMEGLKKERIVIICPKNTMMETWNAHLIKFFKNNQKVWVAGYTKGPLYASVRWIIVNYERIDEVKEFLIKNPMNNLGIIVDESHNFLRTSSQRTQQLIDLTNNNRNADILMMSGTPIKLCGVEMIPLLRVLDPYCDDEAVAIFKRTFGFNTSIANDVLSARLSRMMTRVRKDILNLPEKKESVVNVKMSTGWKYTASQVEKQIVEFVRERQDYYNQHLQQYIEAFEEAITWLKRDPVVGRQPDFQRYLNIIDWLRESHISDARGNADIVWANQYEKDVLIPALPEDLRKKFIWSKSVVKYLPLKIKGEVIGTLLTRLRMQMTTEMLQAADIKQYVDNAVKKTVIFTSYVDTIEVAYNYFKSQGYNVAAVYGKTASELTDTIQRFQEDQSVNPLIASLKMLSTGATLTAANTVIFLNKPWRSIEYQQASDRVHRIGQDTECEIISLVLDTGKEANLSTRMEDIMQWSSDQFDQIVDQKERELMRKFFKSFASLEIPEDCVASLEKYEPPYNEEQMREHGYSEETIERLKNDPVHGWRMETGIELIHREPTRTELKRIWKNWQQMTPDQKRISDRKCRELFGCDNKTLYEYLLPQYKVESPDKGVIKYPPKSDESSSEAISADTKTEIKKITFPSEEIDTLKKQDRIVTTRVNADYNKFFVDDLVRTPWGDIFKVTKREEISDVKDHPYFNELTDGQKKFLSEYDKIAVLTLMKTKVDDRGPISESDEKLTSAQMKTWGDELYHGSPNDLTELKGHERASQYKNSVFLSPLKGIASIFVIDKRDLYGEENHGYRSIHWSYDVWRKDISKLNTIPDHIVVYHNAKSFNETYGESTGYLYTVKLTDEIRAKLKTFGNEDTTRECRYVGDEPLHYTSKQKITVTWETKFDPKMVKQFGPAVESLEDRVDSKSQPSTEQLDSSMEASTTPSKIAQKKKKILDYICKLCDTMEPSGLNSKRYRQIIGQMNDKEFDQFMNYMKEGKWQLHIVAPNMIVNLQNEDLLKACDLIGLDLFQRVWMYDKATGRKFLTDNKYMFVKLPIRRQQQFLDEKISVPDNDRTIDGLTGQVTGDSRSCSITNPEIQILAARGLNNTLQELVNIRGGNIHGYSEFRRMLEENGEGDLDMLDTGSRTRASVVGGKLLQSMMLDTNL